MAEAASAGDGNPLARLRLGLLDALVGSDARADERRGLLGVEARWNAGDVIGIGNKVFGKAAILCISTKLRLRADRFPCRQAILAMTTGRVEPRRADPVTLLDEGDTCSDSDDESDSLVTGNEGKYRLQRPVALGGMEIGVADTTCLGFDEDLARSWSGMSRS